MALKTRRVRCLLTHITERYLRSPRVRLPAPQPREYRSQGTKGRHECCHEANEGEGEGQLRCWCQQERWRADSA